MAASQVLRSNKEGGLSVSLGPSWPLPLGPHWVGLAMSSSCAPCVEFDLRLQTWFQATCLPMVPEASFSPGSQAVGHTTLSAGEGSVIRGGKCRCCQDHSSQFSLRCSQQRVEFWPPLLFSLLLLMSLWALAPWHVCVSVCERTSRGCRGNSQEKSPHPSKVEVPHTGAGWGSLAAPLQGWEEGEMYARLCPTIRPLPGSTRSLPAAHSGLLWEGLP